MISKEVRIASLVLLYRQTQNVIRDSLSVGDLDIACYIQNTSEKRECISPKLCQDGAVYTYLRSDMDTNSESKFKNTEEKKARPFEARDTTEKSCYPAKSPHFPAPTTSRAGLAHHLAIAPAENRVQKVRPRGGSFLLGPIIKLDV